MMVMMPKLSRALQQRKTLGKNAERKEAAGLNARYQFYFYT